MTGLTATDLDALPVGATVLILDGVVGLVKWDIQGDCWLVFDSAGYWPRGTTMSNSELASAKPDVVLADPRDRDEARRLRDTVNAAVREIEAVHYSADGRLCEICGAADGSWPCTAYAEAVALRASLDRGAADV